MTQLTRFPVLCSSGTGSVWGNVILCFNDMACSFTPSSGKSHKATWHPPQLTLLQAPRHFQGCSRSLGTAAARKNRGQLLQYQVLQLPRPRTWLVDTSLPSQCHLVRCEEIRAPGGGPGLPQRPPPSQGLVAFFKIFGNHRLPVAKAWNWNIYHNCYATIASHAYLNACFRNCR